MVIPRISRALDQVTTTNTTVTNEETTGPTVSVSYIAQPVPESIRLTGYVGSGGASSAMGGSGEYYIQPGPVIYSDNGPVLYSNNMEEVRSGYAAQAPAYVITDIERARYETGSAKESTQKANENASKVRNGLMMSQTLIMIISIICLGQFVAYIAKINSPIIAALTPGMFVLSVLALIFVVLTKKFNATSLVHMCAVYYTLRHAHQKLDNAIGRISPLESNSEIRDGQ